MTALDLFALCLAATAFLGAWIALEGARALMNRLKAR